MSKENEVIRKSDKRYHYNPEKTFNTKEQMQAYLVDKMTSNKNKRFNLRIILT
jgi:hypothetical protein